MSDDPIHETGDADAAEPGGRSPTTLAEPTADTTRLPGTRSHDTRERSPEVARQ
ncbi:hypothetical protein GRS48_07950 [Halorubrum sp. JWXQ-INN 858]|uniref:hypothetical protein n=1 Tax=Halorubrum sp. JWXQ-INN 858 TaxID=2690782 RepID=UPI00135CEE4D|nr:hypothetical protein [Halorubrum sp. JWXQ-INN 858]MWV64754.1 hypothetical protein [Halorubrum sp. JWXQ-INN 858]